MNRLRWLFAGAVFLGSFLLFLVEPMAAKQLLPTLGGSAAVWVTCLVYFQTALLAAYLYAHWLARGGRWQVQMALLAAGAATALGWAADAWRPHVSATMPVTAVFVSLTVWIGVPFVALGATSPLLQVWWARTEGTAIPYRLYALSNLASLGALVVYPLAMEPGLTLQMQRSGFAAGFCVFAGLTGALTWKTRGTTAAAQVDDEIDEPAATLGRKLLWVLLPMGAAIQLSTVTSYLTANIAAIPLLWVLPLGVYLITIILAFEFPRLARRTLVARFLVVTLGGLGYMMLQTNASLPMRVSIGFFLTEMFLACLLLHSEAYALRPKRRSESTLFYLLFAAGGAAGSFLAGIAAPLVFRFNYDVAVAFLLTAALVLTVSWAGGWAQRLLWATASVLLAILVVRIQMAANDGALAAARNFYGSLVVRQNHSVPGTTVRVLANGSIQHGTQVFGTDAQRHMPTTYYAEDSGIGLAIRDCCRNRGRTVGVIGLGAGTIAAYGQSTDRMRFYEINPAVEPVAREVFTYMRESRARVTVVEGDGRLALEQEPAQGFDVLAVDAFSGDAIPVHLLTAEALAVYRRQMRPGGIVAFHISNQHVDLEPAIALLARNAGMTAMRVTSAPNEDRGEFLASWVLVTDDAGFFKQPDVAGKAVPVKTVPGLRLWTDDYSSLWPLLH